jgi:hypothetical protein
MGRLKDIDAEMHELPDFEKGVQFERERIIKLLEEQAEITDYVEMQINSLIALIKNFGE